MFYEIEKTQGTNNKKALLKQFENDTEFVKTLRWYFNNLIITGLREKKVTKIANGEWQVHPEGQKDIAKWKLRDLLEYLQECNTGRDLDAKILVTFANRFDKKTSIGIIRIATKSWDKGLGIGRTICNNVYGENFIPMHEVMLCQDYFSDTDYFVGKRFAIQAKLDGFRMTIFKRGNTVSVLSRSGKDQTGNFPLIEKEVLALGPGDFVLDGERMPVGFMEMDSKQQYKLVSESTRKGGSKEVCLAVYDMMSLKDWEKRESDIYENRYHNYMDNLVERKQHPNGLTKIIYGKQKYKYLFALPALYIGDDVSEIEKWLNWAKENDKEGVIVKDMDAMYEWDRTIACAKVKSFFDIDLPIVGFNEGKGRHKGRLGAIEVKYKGNIVKVGSGFSDVMRDEIWKNKNKYMGKTAEIVYFEETSNKAGGISLRFPTFKTTKNGD